MNIATSEVSSVVRVPAWLKWVVTVASVPVVTYGLLQLPPWVFWPLYVALALAGFRWGWRNYIAGRDWKTPMMEALRMAPGYAARVFVAVASTLIFASSLFLLYWHGSDLSPWTYAFLLVLGIGIDCWRTR